jgi:VWFA-related protein
MNLCNPRDTSSLFARNQPESLMTVARTVTRIVTKLVCALCATLFAGPLSSAAQQAPPAVSTPAPSPSSQQIKLEVVVDTKLGEPVTNLGQQDFTILDNKSQRPITGFKVVTAKQEPVEVIIFIDAVNTPYGLVAYVRDQTEKFFKNKEGTLAHPTNFAVFTDNGVEIEPKFSSNGIALSEILESEKTGLREINRSSQWGASDRLNLSVRALHQVTDYAASLPGRKIIIWMSPGFPLLSGPGIYLTPKDEQGIFSDVLYFSSTLRQGHITLYDLNPVGVNESLVRANYYEDFLHGITRPEDAQFADLSIQVLSAQSGGLTLISNNDLAAQIQRCLLDVDSWYEISFDPPPPDKPNEYHRIEVKLAQPGLVARTRNGYYSNTSTVKPSH